MGTRRSRTPNSELGTTDWLSSALHGQAAPDILCRLDFQRPGGQGAPMALATVLFVRPGAHPAHKVKAKGTLLWVNRSPRVRRREPRPIAADTQTPHTARALLSAVRHPNEVSWWLDVMPPAAVLPRV